MREELEQTITHLQEQLVDAKEMGPSELAELKDALDAITATLDAENVNSASLAQKLHSQSEAFQESHPVLTQTVGRLADMLSQMGI